MQLWKISFMTSENNIKRMLWKKVFNSNTFELLTPFKHKFIDKYGASLCKWGLFGVVAQSLDNRC